MNRAPDRALERGIHAHFVDSTGFIRREEWQRAAKDETIVGACRAWGCNGVLQARPITVDGAIEWFGAWCPTCDGEIAAPNGCTIRRSSRHQEIPSGAWDRRIETLTRMQNQAKGEGR